MFSRKWWVFCYITCLRISNFYNWRGCFFNDGGGGYSEMSFTFQNTLLKNKLNVPAAICPYLSPNTFDGPHFLSISCFQFLMRKLARQRPDPVTPVTHTWANTVKTKWEGPPTLSHFSFHTLNSQQDSSITPGLSEGPSALSVGHSGAAGPRAQPATQWNTDLAGDPVHPRSSLPVNPGGI